MISLMKRFLFIHVPKTGGNSIQNILRHYSEDNIVKLAQHHDGIERFQVRNSQYNITKHSPLSHYKSVLEPDVYCKLYKFATIRNPWDRMISYYFSPNRSVKDWNREEFLGLVNKAMTLRHYISNGTCQNIELSNLITYKFPCHKKINADIDFLIKFERIDHDFKTVCKRLEIPYTQLPKRNVSIRAHYSYYYDEELKKVVQNKFQEEIEFGNYVF